MIDVAEAYKFLDALWTEEMGAYREALTIDKWWQNDNYVASIVTRNRDAQRYQIQLNGILNGYTDTRWCILLGDTGNFKESYLILPDWMRYADLTGLQFLYQVKAGEPGGPLLFGVLNKMYGLVNPGFFYDKATPWEGQTTYKLCLFALCAMQYNYMDLAAELIETVSRYQVSSGPEQGGIKTEYIPPEWSDRYPTLLGLANCETTSLAILAQRTYDSKKRTAALLYAGGVAGAATGGIIAGRKKTNG
jgi:hypothetical protein